ncbi:FAD/NAD(P)-binding protein [Streptomyces sp. MMBL 11-1]|uniref:FAD/NAD(P)-binding protein n=1 Tax=Streptomyces sp. MMBL 11-1 TaxID=3026420 RepID=UPI00235DEF21|nr:FAD/NAD(P)-binding protein [Streptomyces sp. MMBL 11-1]
MTRPWRIAVVGSGPRGLMVTERLAARLAREPAHRPVELYVIDEVEVGCGRVYRTDQPEWFLMNTPVGLITAFSGASDGGPARAGAGPSLGQWWQAHLPGHPGPEGYAPRAVYGRYLRFALDAIESGLPPRVRLTRVHDSVLDLEPTANGHRLTLAGGTSLDVDRAVLTTGHARPPVDAPLRDLAEFAARHPGLRCISGDSPAEMPLDTVPAGAAVGVLGLGLSFFDVMAAFTTGRGGVFAEGADGELVYHPSGAEPVMVAGSRSGLPLMAKGDNRRPSGFAYRPLLFTSELVRRHASGPTLDFAADVLPRLTAEIECVYYATALRRAHGERAAAAFTDEVVSLDGATLPDIRAVADRHGAADLAPIDLETLGRPYAGRTFDDPKEFDGELAGLLRVAVEEAERGNVDSPLMAALDVIRDTRWVVRECVDFGRLNPASHRDDFLGAFVPASSVLVAGPPPVRIRQLLALMDRGLLRVAGPETCVDGDSVSGRFRIFSPRVVGSSTPVDIVIDARVPVPDLGRDPAQLTANLRARGLWTEFVSQDADDRFETGGVAVTTAPFHPVDRDGRPGTGLYVLGVPTENTRWFTQVGFARPGPWGDFVRDADAIAEHALAEAATP